MTSNSPEIIQDIRLEFEKVLAYVTGEQARTATADQIGYCSWNLRENVEQSLSREKG